MPSSKGEWDKGGKRVARSRYAFAGTAANAAVVFEASLGPVKITRAALVTDASLTGAATNNAALGLVNKKTGTATTAVTTVRTYTSGVNQTAFIAEELPLSSTAADLVMAQGAVLALAKTVNGDALAIPSGEVVIEFVPL